MWCMLMNFVSIVGVWVVDIPYICPSCSLFRPKPSKRLEYISIPMVSVGCDIAYIYIFISEYLDEGMRLPKNTSVLVRQVLGRPRMPIATEKKEEYTLSPLCLFQVVFIVITM